MPQPSPAARQLETIGPHLVGVWRTKLRDGSLQLSTGPAIELADAVEAASTEASDVVSAARSALRAALAAREAAAKSAQAAATAAAAAIVLEREVGYAAETPPPEAARGHQAAPTIGDAQAALAAQVTAAAEILEPNGTDRSTDETVESLTFSRSSAERA
jgi:transposase-like protein